jgi:hypothetical protein
MRKLLIALMLLWGGFASAAAWLHDYETALEQAQKEHKPIMMIYVKKG